MTTLSLPTRPTAYTLADGLREPAAASPVHRGAPDDWAHEELLLRKLGARGWGRVHQFRNYYESGWGDKGRVLSPRALDAFFRFLEAATFPTAAAVPSVFLTDQGGIELCWEDRQGQSVQVEFTATGAEFYRAATDEEGVVAFEALAQLPQRLLG
jgi:hypothetical protein